MRLLTRHPLAAGVTLAIVAAWAAPVPALTDPLGGALPAAWQLHRSLGYAIIAPLATLWDQIAMLPISRLTGLLTGLGVLYLAWRIQVRRTQRVRWTRAVLRECWVLVMAVAGFVTFVLLGLVWHDRPVARLAGLAADELTLEMHSHTNASHDVRGFLVEGFDAVASREWHERAGVDLLFITDHNTTRGWRRFRGDLPQGRTQICPGIELSAHGAHVVVLGEPLPESQQPYRGSPAHRARLFAEIAALPGAVAIASLPEYRGQAEQFIAEGVRGFEITSASPKGNDLPRIERDSIIALARRHDLLLVGAGDQHGYGATPMVWNVMHLPGWRTGQGPPCAGVVSQFRSGGPETVRIVERTRLRTDSALPWILTPLGVLWMAWATTSVPVALGWLVWVWAAALAGSWYRTQQRRRHEAAVAALTSRRR
ncbi:MAG: PHP domain-containing protein [Gemmatimonadales bacterium]